MGKIILNFQVTGCANHCFHCHCNGGVANKTLIDADLVRRIANDFRKSLDSDVSVYLLEEQTYYPDFFKLVNGLESDGFMKKDSAKMLVTNCWGLANIPNFIDEMKEHFSSVKPTLFGIDKTHDIHAGRKGSYKDIIESSKLCIEKGINVIWEIMWTKINTKEIDKLFEAGNNIGIKNIFISGGYLYTGAFIKNEDRFLPLVDDLEQVKHEIYEYKKGCLKTPGQYIEDINNGNDYEDEVYKVSLDELYIDKDLNVYPLCHLSKEFCLGNIKDSFDEIIKKLKDALYLPKAILNKRALKFSELVSNRADVNSRQLYTPQALFDKLCINELRVHL